jgi:CheY-like chemotaxis protein
MVWDKGIGISPEGMSQLFQPFVQLDGGLNREQSGTGLGLALVRRMAELQGGSVILDSELGKGSSFTISLPWRETKGKSVPSTKEQCGKQIKTMLVIEDSEVIREQITRYCEELRIQTLSCDRMGGALKMAIEKRPDVILLDILLPDGDGWTVLDALKQEPRTRDIPVVVVSVVEEKARAYALGVTGYMVKPFDVKDLCAVLQLVENQSQVAAVPNPMADISEALVLLAEDNDSVALTIRGFLEKKGFKVVRASDGAEAVELVSKFNPSIVLMDVQMPKMDGLEATKRIRALPEVGFVPIIALTALAMQGDADLCLEAGANHYLSKPVSLPWLQKTIESFLLQNGGTS